MFKNQFLKQIRLACAFLSVLAITPFSYAYTVKIGFLADITGPTGGGEIPSVIEAGQLATDQINEQGGLFEDGVKLLNLIGDTKCNAKAAVEVSKKLLKEKISGFVGPTCSDAAIAVAEAVAIPNNIALISHSATAPSISKLKDKDLVFRTAPSDEYQAKALTSAVMKKEISSVAITYIDNNYGRQAVNVFQEEFKKKGGGVLAILPHKENQKEYTKELELLSKSGASTLIIFSYGSSPGWEILKQARDKNLFLTYFGSDGMADINSMIDVMGSTKFENFYITMPVGIDAPSLYAFKIAYQNEGGVDSIYISTGYDAVFIMALAIEAAQSTNPIKVAKAIREVTNAPGEKIYPGQWKRARELLEMGEDVNYVGATGYYDFDKNGDMPGTFNLFKIKDGAFVEDLYDIYNPETDNLIR